MQVLGLAAGQVRAYVVTRRVAGAPIRPIMLAVTDVAVHAALAKAGRRRGERIGSDVQVKVVGHVTSPRSPALRGARCCNIARPVTSRPSIAELRSPALLVPEQDLAASDVPDESVTLVEPVL